MLGYKASPTGQRFMDSRKFVKVVMGPVGGGKSTVCLMDLFRRSCEQAPFNTVRRTRFVILRNTMAQLKSTVKPIIETWFVTMTGGRMGQWRLSENTFEARFRLTDGTVVHSEYILLAADTPEDVRRLLSLEASAAWVEESREVVQDVFEGLQGRVDRFPARVAGGVTEPGVIASTNPPPIGGFWHKTITEPSKNTEVFIQPAALLEDGTINPEAENLEFLSPTYYENLLEGKSEEWVRVYLMNKFGQGDNGRPLYKHAWKRSFHVAPKPLMAIPSTIHPLVVGMDNGLQAAAAILQQDARGRVNILGEAYVPEDETMGVEKFLDTLLVPKLRGEKFAHIPPERVVFVLDPACFQRSQVDEKTIAMAVMQRGYQVVRASTNDPERRIDAVEGLLLRQIDGSAGLLVSPECTHVIDTLEWGHRYKKSASGVHTTTVEKNHHSHMGDGIQYGALHYNVQSGAGAMFRRNAGRREVVPSRYVYS